MEFIHANYALGDTIAAITTPPGDGGVAIVRLSGNGALDVAASLFSGPVHRYRSHTAHFGQIRNAQGEHIDDALVLVMHAPRSYTGETTVEIQCHGGRLITRRVLETVLQAGARAALPGEFTFRAFINGKMDLAQAEAVQALIGAKNDLALEAAENQLKGRLSRAITAFQRELTQVAAILEAWVDFPEEGLEFTTVEELARDLRRIVQEMAQLAATFRHGRIIHEGLSLCLIGRPNVGKSSLMNALLDKERAIVSAVPGTTRDIVEDHLRLNGLHVKISDTAGIRTTTEGIEQEGIRRSMLAAEEADLILLVLDAAAGFTAEDRSLFSLAIPQKTIAVWNKVDLPHGSLPDLPLSHAVPLSAKQRIGLPDLHAAIEELIWHHAPPSKEEIVITQLRHQEALNGAIEALHRVVRGLDEQLSPELLTVDMRQSLMELGKIVGSNVTEDILSAIFATFCIGK